DRHQRRAVSPAPGEAARGGPAGPPARPPGRERPGRPRRERGVPARGAGSAAQERRRPRPPLPPRLHQPRDSPRPGRARADHRIAAEPRPGPAVAPALRPQGVAYIAGPERSHRQVSRTEGDPDSEDWLRQQFRLSLGSVRPPRPDPAQARYKAPGRRRRTALATRAALG